MPLLILGSALAGVPHSTRSEEVAKSPLDKDLKCQRIRRR